MITEKSKAIIKPQTVILTFEHLHLKLKVKKEEKVILEDISGSVQSGEVLAILGASGAGKSSLLNMLAGRIPKECKATGKVLINGSYFTSKEYKDISGYVLQDDILFSFQSVDETMSFSAFLRCPANFSDKDCIERKDKVIAQLGLINSKDTKIGNEFKRGISGGERKRVCIGVEIVRNVSILFLDEPTTGLDSFMAYTVVKHLSDLAKNMNMLVIFTIHQPRSNIFELFDKLMLISNGKTVYFGDAKESIPYFEKTGHECPPGFNFTDFLLDISAPDYRSEENKKTSLKRIDDLHKHWQEIEEQRLALKKTESETADPLKSKKQIKIFDQRKKRFYSQFPLVLTRQLKEQMRNYIFIIAQVAQTIFTALLIGCVFYGLGKNEINDKFGVLFFLVLSQTAGPLFQTITVFYLTKSVFLREFEAGFYSPVAFYLSSFQICILLEPLYTLIFLSVVYFMVGLKATASAFFMCYITLLLSKICAISLALLISSAFKKLQFSQIVTPMILYVMILFGGLYIQLDNINKVLYYIQFGNYLRYAYLIVTNNEFVGNAYDIGGNIVSGISILENRGLKLDSYAIPFSFLVLCSLLFAVAGMLLLRVNVPTYTKLKDEKSK